MSGALRARALIVLSWELSTNIISFNPHNSTARRYYYYYFHCWVVSVSKAWACNDYTTASAVKTYRVEFDLGSDTAPWSISLLMLTCLCVCRWGKTTTLVVVSQLGEGLNLL